MSSSVQQVAPGRLPSSAYTPTAYGFTRGCMASAIAPLLEQRLAFCMTLSGGYTDPEGVHWTWQSAEALRVWLEEFHGVICSADTVARALAAIVGTGRWVREQLGRRMRDFFYRPAAGLTAECIPHQAEMHAAMGRDTTDPHTGPTYKDPERCALSEPSDPCPGPGCPPRERPVKRGDRPDPNRCQNPGAVPFERPEWITHQGVPEHEIFTRIDPQQPQERPEPAMPDESRTEPLRLDSRPTDSPVELEAGSVTDQNSASPALNALNTAKVRGWFWDAVVGLFRHRDIPARTVAVMAQAYGVTEAQLLDVLGGNRLVRE